MLEMTCPADGELVARELDKIATQYREATWLKAYMAAVLREIEQAGQAACDIPNHFDLLTSTGEQLTFIGKRMGFGRCHCVCVQQPVFGFKCEGHDVVMQPLVGFCEDGSWASCNEAGVGELCIYDDDVYRAHLLARRYQMLGLFDVESLTAAIRIVWGPTAWIVDAHRGRLVLSPGRPLGAEEIRRMVLTLRILPIAPGVEVRMWLRTDPIVGFGEGWAGICKPDEAPTVAGFECDDGSTPDVTGFCEENQTWARCLPPAQAAGVLLCPVRIDPYGCN